MNTYTLASIKTVLERLIEAAEVYEADQTGCDDLRFGYVPQITMAEGEELIAALEVARDALVARDRRTGGEVKTEGIENVLDGVERICSLPIPVRALSAALADLAIARVELDTIKAHQEEMVAIEKRIAKMARFVLDAFNLRPQPCLSEAKAAETLDIDLITLNQCAAAVKGEGEWPDCWVTGFLKEEA